MCLVGLAGHTQGSTRIYFLYWFWCILCETMCYMSRSMWLFGRMIQVCCMYHKGMWLGLDLLGCHLPVPTRGCLYKVRWICLVVLHNEVVCGWSKEKSPTTSCVLDPLPTWLLKDMSDNVVPFQRQLINTSIASGVVPCCLKHANDTHVPKKANIDQDNMNNYRPISNFPFVSKLLERYVARCLLDHMTANNLLERYQSAYKSHHSTETALVLVQNDTVGALGRRGGVILTRNVDCLRYS